MSNDNENKRKTLKLGKINNDIQKNIESFTKGSKILNKTENIKKDTSLDSKNATEFYTATVGTSWDKATYGAPTSSVVGAKYIKIDNRDVHFFLNIPIIILYILL